MDGGNRKITADRLLELLELAGRATAKELSEMADIHENAVKVYLRQLVDAGRSVVIPCETAEEIGLPLTECPQTKQEGRRRVAG